MNEHDATAAVVAAIREAVPGAEPEGLAPDEDLATALDLDSMDRLNIVIALYEATGVEIPEADLPAIRTIGDFASRLTAAA